MIVYLAGYAGKKSLRRFACRTCEQMWMRSSVDVPDKPENGFILLQNKQYYDYLVEGGLFVPSQSMVNFVSSLETIFRKNIAPDVHANKVIVQFLSKVYEADDVCVITSSNTHVTLWRDYTELARRYKIYQSS